MLMSPSALEKHTEMSHLCRRKHEAYSEGMEGRSWREITGTVGINAPESQAQIPEP